MDWIKKSLGYSDLEVVDPTQDHGLKAQDSEKRNALWEILKQFVGGGDATRAKGLSLPISVYEPSTSLTVALENFQYYDLLNKAAEATDACDRMSWVLAWLVSSVSKNTRTGKPFNPVLGETIQHQCDDGSVKFFGEQVSHHPPIGAVLASGKGWRVEFNTAHRSKFWGNSVELFSLDEIHVYFDDGGHISCNTPTVCVYNVIVGTMWIDTYGDIDFVDHNDDEIIGMLSFTKCGWLSRGRYEVSGTVMKGEDEVYELDGKWSVSLVRTSVSGGSKITMWERNQEIVNKRHGLSQFALDLVQLGDDEGKGLLPTDGRKRADLQALLRDEPAAAADAKHEIEERQRADRRAREEKGETWEPKFFKGAGEGAVDENWKWDYQGGAWEEVDQLVKNLKL